MEIKFKNDQVAPYYPVDEICHQLCEAFSSKDIILSAPPGAGKSTRVPLALLKHFPNKRFLLLQPRRVVVKHLSQFLAKQLNEAVGNTIGYQMRGDSKVSSTTRLVIVTEGVLTRLLQDDPELAGFDGVIFDEFHERSVHADLGLAFAIESQQQLRQELRLMVMSATLDIDALTTLLPQAEVLSSQGRMFPVGVFYRGDCTLEDVCVRIVETIKYALKHHPSGNLLVFLPSAKFIRRCQALITMADVNVKPLYGALSIDEQQRAIQPQNDGQRSIILATNIAETSLTIEGISIVIDSGRVQEAKFNHRSAITALSTKMVPQPSTIQRMGRAGRLSEGHCYRLWSKTTQERLNALARPAIKEVDLTPNLLDVLVWGTQFEHLALIDQPEPAQLRHGYNTLELLGLTEGDGRLTQQGRMAHQSGFHPRVAAMLLACRNKTPQLKLAASIAACLVEQINTLTYTNEKNVEVGDLIKWVQKQTEPQHRTFKQALSFCDLKQNTLEQKNSLWDEVTLHQVAACFAIAYPERVAFKQKSNQFKLAYGPRFQPKTLDTDDQWCVLIDGLYQSNGDIISFLTLPCDEVHLKEAVPNLFTDVQSLSVNVKKGSIEARAVTKLGDSVYAQTPMQINKKFNWAEGWKQAIANGELGNEEGNLPLNNEGEQWLVRAQIATRLGVLDLAGLELSHENLLASSEQWLDSSLSTCKTVKQIEGLPWSELLNGLLTWEQQQALASLLPVAYTIPTGQKRSIEYKVQQGIMSASLSAKLQALFGVNAPLSVANGKLTLTLDLLSPAGRPLQTTQDLAGFWQGSYHQLAKEMRGRYPKHPWPDDPGNAAPMAGTKKAHRLS